MKFKRSPSYFGWCGGVVLICASSLVLTSTFLPADAQIRQVRTFVEIHEKTLSDGTPCAYIIDENGVSLSCGWRGQSPEPER